MRTMEKKALIRSAPIAAAVLLAACGGGGGGTAVFNPVVQMTAFKQPVYCAQFPAAFQD